MSQSFKRFRLVDDEEFQRERTKQLRDYNPELTAEVRKQTSVNETLNDPNLNPELKLLMLRILNHSVQTIAKSYKRKTPPLDVKIAFDQPGFKTEIPILQQPVEDEEAFHDVEEPAAENVVEDEDEGLSMDMFADTIPNAFKDKATQVAHILSSSPDQLRVNKNKELIIDGQRIQNSNAPLMLKYLYTPKNSPQPIGYAIFIKKLADFKISPNLISNKRIQSHLQSAYQSGYGKRLRKPIGFAKRSLSKSSSHSSLNSLKLYKI